MPRPCARICAHFNEETFPKLKSEYIDTGKVFYVFRAFMPIGPADGPAEKLARCLPHDKYLAFIDMLFRNQAKWDPEYRHPSRRASAALLELAKGFGMSAADADRCVADPPRTTTAINKVGEDGMPTATASTPPPLS